MSTTCPSCGTDNRPFAKYCIECVSALPATFAPTIFLPRLGAASAAPNPTTPRPTVPPPISTAPMPPRLVDEPATRTAESQGAAKPAGKKGLWVSVAAFALALAVGAGGWMIAGAGGWYIYSTASTPTTSGPAEPVAAVAVNAGIAPTGSPVSPTVAPMVAPTLAAASSPAVPTVTPAAPTPTDAAPAAMANIQPAPAAAASAVPVPKAAAGASPRTSSNASSATRENKSRPVAAAPAAAERFGNNPADQCTGLGFFALSRCMATQCAKPAYSPHATCESVRRQQQLMEEKRNPTLNR